MRYSKSFIKTQKDKKAPTPGLEFLERAGYIIQNSAGFYSYLPLGFRVLENLRRIIQEELAKAGVLEIMTPVLHSAELWKESGRYFEVKDELWKIKGRTKQEYVLAMTAEEIFTDIIRRSVNSYKDLPLILNQIQTKVRDEPRPRGGLLRLREFLMQDAYSFDNDEEGMDKSHDKIFQAYQRIFQRAGLRVLPVEADVGAMGGSASFEFMISSPIGEDKIAFCPKCHYAANIEKATVFLTPEPPKQEKKKEEVHTPKMKTVVEVAEFLKISPKKILKTIAFKVNKKIILVVIRGDLKINLKKLANLLNTDPSEIAPVNAQELEREGLIEGFLSSVKPVPKNVQVIADLSVKFIQNFVTGANKYDYHFKNVNLKDLKIDLWADLIEVYPGSSCPSCSGPLKVDSAIELGHTFKLGTRYSSKMKAEVVDQKGKKQPIQMGCYGIGLDRLLQSIAEVNSDDRGLAWNKEVAPFRVYLIDLKNDSHSLKIAQKIERDLEKSNCSVLYDDRDDVSAGVKFMEADLLGLPFRLTLSPRTLAKNSVEIKQRGSQKTKLIKIRDIVNSLKKLA